MVERQEKELSRLQTSNEELQERNRSLEAALDSSYKYILCRLVRSVKISSCSCESSPLFHYVDVWFFLLFRELAELHKANASKDSEAQELALSREVQAKEELGLALEKAQEESRLQQEALANQVTSLIQLLLWWRLNEHKA